MPKVVAISLSFSESSEEVNPVPLILSSSLAAVTLAFSYSEDALPRDLAISGIFFAPKIIIGLVHLSIQNTIFCLLLESKPRSRLVFLRKIVA